MFRCCKSVRTSLTCLATPMACLILAVSPSSLWADNVVTGAQGSSGTDAQDYQNDPGGDGGDGQPASASSADPVNKAYAGDGGAGGDGNPPGQGGDGGDATATGTEYSLAEGGNGGGGASNGSTTSDTSGTGGMAGNATADATSVGLSSSTAIATGGVGGYSLGQGQAGTAQSGGTASADAEAAATSAIGLTSRAVATGGNGGDGFTAGSGGSATASATGTSNYGGSVLVEAEQTGGNGGRAYFKGGDPADAEGGIGGNGAESLMLNKVGGHSTGGSITLKQTATGGAAGNGNEYYDSTNSTQAAPGYAGNATSTINHDATHGEITYRGESYATGGAGGMAWGSTLATAGGNATASTTLQADTLTSTSTDIVSRSTAIGGAGGTGSATFETNSLPGTAAQGGPASANAYAGAVNGDATANASAEGGAGGNMDSLSTGGLGGNANADATAVTVTGKATAQAVADAGDGGSDGTRTALGGVATATVTVKAGSLQLSANDVASDGGIASVSLVLDAPVGGAASIPGSLGGITLDSSTAHTLTVPASGPLAMNHAEGSEITVTGASHTIASQVNFTSDATVDIQGSGASNRLLLSASPSITEGINLTKAGAGQLVVQDDLDLSPSGLQILMESGTFSTSSQVDVSGDLTLDKTLDMDLVGGHEPSIGDGFDILTYTGTLTGEFDTVEFPAVDGLTFGLVYGSSGTISLQTVLEGDLDNDGFVGLGDLDIVLNNWNQTVTAGVLLEGDPTGDGFVGLGDKDLVLTNWGSGTPPGQSASVPEPATLALAVLGGVALLRRS